MRFALSLYEDHVQEERFFIHEHPNGASSWWLPKMVEFMSKYQLTNATECMCRFGMMPKDEHGVGLVKTPTGFLTNSRHAKKELGKMCLGVHKHVPRLSGRAAAAQVYPDKLCRAMPRTIKRELVEYEARQTIEANCIEHE